MRTLCVECGSPPRKHPAVVPGHRLVHGGGQPTRNHDRRRPRDSRGDTQQRRRDANISRTGLRRRNTLSTSESSTSLRWRPTIRCACTPRPHCRHAGAAHRRRTMGALAEIQRLAEYRGRLREPQDPVHHDRSTALRHARANGGILSRTPVLDDWRVRAFVTNALSPRRSCACRRARRC